jgi:hypothetical protein
MKKNSLSVIRKKLCLLYLLNVADIIFTVLLLRTGYFSEINIFMVRVIENPFACILVKVILPIILIYYIYMQMANATQAQLKASNIAINISLSLYALVNVTHLIWTASLPFLYLYA